VSIFHSIGVFAYRFRWAILLLWGMVLISSSFFAPGLSGQLKGGGFDGANSEAERVQDLMSDEFGLSPATLTVVFTGDGLSARSEEFQNAQENALANVRRARETIEWMPDLLAEVEALSYEPLGVEASYVHGQLEQAVGNLASAMRVEGEEADEVLGW
jgi:uncharacterized membrane protein YdfJ with MMPL/SSD domain